MPKPKQKSPSVSVVEQLAIAIINAKPPLDDYSPDRITSLIKGGDVFSNKSYQDKDLTEIYDQTISLVNLVKLFTSLTTDEYDGITLGDVKAMVSKRGITIDPETLSNKIEYKLAIINALKIHAILTKKGKKRRADKVTKTAKTTKTTKTTKPKTTKRAKKKKEPATDMTVISSRLPALEKITAVLNRNGNTSITPAKFEEEIYDFVTSLTDIDDYDGYYRSKVIDMLRIVDKSSAITLNVVPTNSNIKQIILTKAWDTHSELWGDVLDKHNKTVGQISEDIISGEALIHDVYSCNACGAKDIYMKSEQTRGNDEAETIFLRCSKCSTSWRG